MAAARGFVFGIDAAGRPGQAGPEGDQHAGEVLGPGQVFQIITENEGNAQAAQEKTRDDEPVRPAPVEPGGIVDHHHEHRNERQDECGQSAGNVTFTPAHHAVTQRQHQYAGNRLVEDIGTAYTEVIR
ncbi:hypothetical protein D9M69_586980 [compost metagenome]